MNDMNFVLENLARQRDGIATLENQIERLVSVVEELVAHLPVEIGHITAEDLLAELNDIKSN